MIGAWLLLTCLAGAVVLITEGRRAYLWHHGGMGERTAHDEYARVRREWPDTAEARLSEAEFVRHYVASRPGAVPYVIAVLLLVLIGVPASCTLMMGWWS